MNKTLIITIIVILLIVAGYFIFRGSSTPTLYPSSTDQTPISINNVPQTPTSTSTKENLVVNYTDSGFSPKTITIKKGQTVTFVNQSSSDMWVASNPHPVHTDYPGFDEKASVGNGGSWSFTFNKVGQWGYHNHKNPSSGGTVVVE